MDLASRYPLGFIYGLSNADKDARKRIKIGSTNNTPLERKAQFKTFSDIPVYFWFVRALRSGSTCSRIDDLLKVDAAPLVHLEDDDCGTEWYTYDKDPTQEIDAWATRMHIDWVDVLAEIAWLEKGRSSSSPTSPLEDFPINQITLTPPQAAVVHDFSQEPRSGLVVHATGMGKSVTALALIGVWLRANQGRVALWHTSRKDILEPFVDSLTRDDIRALIPDITIVDGRKKIVSSDIPGTESVLVVCNSAKLKHVLQHLIGRLGLIITDESHDVSAPQVFALLRPLDVIHVGLSATPYRSGDATSRMNSAVLFRERLLGGRSYDLLDAMEADLIVPVHLCWIAVPSEEIRKLTNETDIQRCAAVLAVFLEAQGFTGDWRKANCQKAIVWAGTQLRAKMGQIMMRILAPHVGVKPKNVMLSTSVNDPQNHILKKFLNISHSAALVTAERFRQGTDAPSLALGISVEILRGRRAAHRAVQMAGRLTRKAPGKTEAYFVDVVESLEERDNLVSALCQGAENICCGDFRRVRFDWEPPSIVVRGVRRGNVAMTFRAVNVDNNTTKTEGVKRLEMTYQELKKQQTRLNRQNKQKWDADSLRAILPIDVDEPEKYVSYAQNYPELVLPHNPFGEVHGFRWILLDRKGRFYSTRVECENAAVKLDAEYAEPAQLRQARNFSALRRFYASKDSRYPAGDVLDRYY